MFSSLPHSDISCSESLFFKERVVEILKHQLDFNIDVNITKLTKTVGVKIFTFLTYLVQHVSSFH